MNINLESKTAIVTGGEHGIIGPVITNILKAIGARVICCDWPDYDLNMPHDIERFCQSPLLQHYTPSIIVHNAAIDPKPGTDDGSNPFRRHAEIMQVNHIAVAHINSLLIPKMIDNGGGIIIVIGSIMGYISANPDNYADGWLKAFSYNESKAALIMHCHNVNTVYGKQGIRCVMPSFGPYEKGLSPEFMEGFGKKIPMLHPVSKTDLILTIKYCLECESLAGEFRIDGGYTRISR